MFCDMQISAEDVLSRIHHRRMDQANHNLLMAVGGWGALLLPCYRTAVTIFYYEAREREARLLFLVPKKKSRRSV